MNITNRNGWERRLWLSVIYAGLAVVLSTAIVLVLSAVRTPADSRSQGLSGIDAAMDIFGIPLVTGWLVVSSVFGEWRAVHQGQIVLVPIISGVIDSLLIFVVWEFLHRKASRELGSDSVLHIDG